MAEQHEQDEQDGPQPINEVWIYAGTRDNLGRRFRAWLPADQVGDDDPDDGELYFKRHSGVVGSEYTVPVIRTPDKTTITDTPTYLRQHPDADVRARLEAQHRAAETRLRLRALQNNDRRRSALNDALQPMLDIMATIPYPDREAVIVYVTRLLHGVAPAGRRAGRRGSR